MGCDNPDTMLDEQRWFIAYLMAYSPTIESIRMYMRFQDECDTVEETDFLTKIKQNDDTLRIIAKSHGYTLDEYKAHVARQMKEKAILELRTKYGCEDDMKSESSPHEDDSFLSGIDNEILAPDILRKIISEKPPVIHETEKK